MHWKQLIFHDASLHSTSTLLIAVVCNKLIIKHYYAIANQGYITLHDRTHRLIKGTCVCLHGWWGWHSRGRLLGYRQCPVARSCSVCSKFHMLCGRVAVETLNGISQHMLHCNLGKFQFQFQLIQLIKSKLTHTHTLTLTSCIYQSMCVKPV